MHSAKDKMSNAILKDEMIGWEEKQALEPKHV